MVKRWKTKAMVTKFRRNRGEINLSSEKERNYKINTKDNTNPDQVNDSCSL